MIPALLQVYVWDNVLTDYTDGLVVVIAYNEEEARRLALAEIGLHDDSTVRWEFDRATPEVFKLEPHAWYVWGGS